MNAVLKKTWGGLLLSILCIACDQVSDEVVAREECLRTLGKLDTSLVFEEQWTSLAALNTPHQFHAAVAIKGKLYAVGGAQTLSRESAAFEVYDPLTNRWDVLENMPTPRYFLAAAAEGGNIYAIGGIGEGAPEDTLDLYHATVEAYNVDEKRWSRVADLPTPRNRLDAIAFGGHIYAIGGLTREGDTGIVEVYDPETDRWIRRADMPTARHGHSIVVVNEEILVIGGYAASAGGPVATVESYNPLADTWSTRADMLTARGFLGAAVVKGYAYAMAGRYRDETNPVERYNPCLDEWTSLGSVPGSFRNRFGAAAIDSLIYLIGGEFQGDERLPKSLEQFDPG